MASGEGQNCLRSWHGGMAKALRGGSFRMSRICCGSTLDPSETVSPCGRVSTRPPRWKRNLQSIKRKSSPWSGTPWQAACWCRRRSCEPAWNEKRVVVPTTTKILPEVTTRSGSRTLTFTWTGKDGICLYLIAMFLCSSGRYGGNHEGFFLPKQKTSCEV